MFDFIDSLNGGPWLYAIEIARIEVFDITISREFSYVVIS